MDECKLLIVVIVKMKSRVGGRRGRGAGVRSGVWSWLWVARLEVVGSG